MGHRVSAAVRVLAVGLLWVGCSTSSEGLPQVDAEADLEAGAGGKKDGPSDAPGCSTSLATKKAMGQACGCAEECASGFCVSGVCCNTVCTGTCMACNISSTPGRCSPVAAGSMPVVAGQCKTDPPSTCSAGFDGTCDGSGKCRAYGDTTTCSAANKCSGSTVTGAMICNGASCNKPGPAIQCAPYNCDAATGACFTKCAANKDCVAGVSCVGGKCAGKRPIGSPCQAKADCESGFCADGVCCNLACTGACLSCSLPTKMGQCSPVGAKVKDPHAICKEEGANTCGQSGLCNGLGGCSKYASGTICRDASCSGGSLVPASTCNGNGTCGAGSPITCAPYACVGGACKTDCDSNADCSGSNSCASRSCGLKGIGQTCGGDSECKPTVAGQNFGQCVDGVCCDSDCRGTCRYCASPSSLGRCVNVSAGAPAQRGECSDQGASSCGNDGMCNGSGACEQYSTGTECRPESCDSGTNLYRHPAVCNNGSCSTPTAETCAPFKCNGTRCATSCGDNGQCVSPNVCTANSCGLKPIGAVCAMGNECASKFCAQGVCCSTACTASCFSCALASSMGMCKVVPPGGSDPAGACKDGGPSSCGNDGFCNGSGACRNYGAGTVCAQPSCKSGTATTASACNGTGNCVAGAMQSCGAYTCNANGSACYASCTGDAQCSGANKCVGGFCDTKANGASCTDKSECKSNFCVDGVCCNSACSGVCKTCALTATPGMCGNVPGGVADPNMGCAVSLESSCGTDGKCDGTGACRKWQSGTPCRGASCPNGSSTRTLSAVCDGNGTCPAGVTESCGTFKCDPLTSSCRTTCMNDVDCTAGNFCNQMTCGLNKLGASCTADAQCMSNHCVDGTCCSTAACGTCQTCSNMAGACANVANGGTDPDSCTDNSAQCGTTGICDGSGKCPFVSGTPCGQSCQGDDVVTRTCNGGGACTGGGGATTSCSPYTCRAGACLNTCNSMNDCVSGKVCINNQCINPPVDAAVPDAAVPDAALPDTAINDDAARD